MICHDFERKTQPCVSSLSQRIWGKTDPSRKVYDTLVGYRMSLEQCAIREIHLAADVRRRDGRICVYRRRLIGLQREVVP